MKATYIHDDCVYADQYNAVSIVLEKEKEYDVEIQYDGPQVIINGQALAAPGSSYIVTVNGAVQIPYAPERLKDFWRIVE